jgi:uncharacterized membrane protein
MWKRKRMSRYFLITILVVYFIFTSGFVFEITQSKSTAQIDVPYNTALSAERTGIVGIFTDCDVKCAKWITEKTPKNSLVAGDVNSSLLLMSFITQDRIRKTISDKVYDYETLPKTCYIMVLDWNVRHNQFVRVAGTGTRQILDMPELNYPEVYRCGNSRVLYKE